MNIFYLDPDPHTCAQMHCDRHVVKMILETAQMLSTAHRVSDGTPTLILGDDGKTRKHQMLEDPDMERVLYKATHALHPSTIWATESRANYNWLFALFEELCEEYTYRYGKVHKCSSMREALRYAPRRTRLDMPTPIRKAMPDTYKQIPHPVSAYRTFYGTKPFKMTWKNRCVPFWFEDVRKDFREYDE